MVICTIITGFNKPTYLSITATLRLAVDYICIFKIYIKDGTQILKTGKQIRRKELIKNSKNWKLGMTHVLAIIEELGGWVRTVQHVMWLNVIEYQHLTDQHN